jgi:type VI secretion system secreted protein Hcp
MFMPIFVKFADLKGNVTAKGYQDWSEVQHARFDISRPVKVEVGHKNDRIGQQPSFSHVSLTKLVDNASNSLFQIACQGKAIAKVDLHICATNDELLPYLKYTFDNVIIAKHETAFSNGGSPIELFQLSFTRVQCHYVGRDGANKPMSPFISGYNLETAEIL